MSRPAIARGADISSATPLPWVIWHKPLNAELGREEIEGPWVREIIHGMDAMRTRFKELHAAHEASGRLDDAPWIDDGVPDDTPMGVIVATVKECAGAPK